MKIIPFSLLCMAAILISACGPSRIGTTVPENNREEAAFQKLEQVHDVILETLPDSVFVLHPLTNDTIHMAIVDTFTSRINISGARPITATIIGVGDIMLGTDYPSPSYLPPNDGKNILDGVKEVLIDADVTFGNLEGCFLNDGPVAKRCSDPSKCYAFRMPEHYGAYLGEAGFDVMSMANNHVRDFGQAGIETSQRVLDNEGIYHAGLLDKPFTIFEKNGLTYGMAAFSPNTGTCRINDYDGARATVAHLDTVCDIVIVSFHGGAEGSKHEHVTRKTEYFYGENRGNVYEFARVVIDAGADIVFGHGPHVTRAVDLYKERFIIYSLGNFATYGRFNLSGVNGYAPIVKVTTDSDGQFLEARITPIVQVARGIPQIDEQNRVVSRLRYLTEKDLPDCGIEVAPDGWIVKKAPLLETEQE